MFLSSGAEKIFMDGIILKPPVTSLSCLALGLGFVIAVALLAFAGILIGWVLPCPRRGPGSPRKRPVPAAVPRIDPPEDAE
jgi:hypothetical protein